MRSASKDRLPVFWLTCELHVSQYLASGLKLLMNLVITMISVCVVSGEERYVLRKEKHQKRASKRTYEQITKSRLRHISELC